MQVEEMITRGITPPPVELRAWMVKQGCPETLIRSVADKNAGLDALRAVEKRMGRTRVAEKRSTRRTVVMTQDQIDEMVDNRDLTKYPLSRAEELDIEARQRRLNAIQSIL